MNDFEELSINKIYNEAYKTNHLTSVMIELLTTCNWRCKHCYIPEHNNLGLDTNTLINLLKDLRNSGVLNVSFTGGEIFLRKDILHLIETARDLYFRVYLLSNASLLTEEIIQFLAKMHIESFSTTVFSLNPEIHDFITGVKGSLDRSLKNIFMLKKYNVNVMIKTPLMEINKFAYKELSDFCNKNHFAYMSSPIIFAKSNGDKSTYKLRINPEDLKLVVKDTDKAKKDRESDRPFLYEYDEPCSAFFYSIAIDCEGNVYPCNSMYYKIGNIFDNSISDIWNNSNELRYIKSIKKENLDECKKCSLKSYCERCPGLALLEDNALTGCSSSAKQMALVRKSINKS